MSQVKGLPSGQFKRLTGVKRETFELVLSVPKQSEQEKKRLGRPSKLSLADQLLLKLMYWREYRTQFHIAKGYDIHEANVNRTIRKVEGALTTLGEFKLPGKRAARSDEGVEISFIIVDVTETPIEETKKAKTVLQRQKAMTHPEGASAFELGNA